MSEFRNKIQHIFTSNIINLICTVTCKKQRANTLETTHKNHKITAGTFMHFNP